jgi:hypothetical protein
MRPWPERDPRRNGAGPRPISGFEGQFSGLMPEIVALPPEQLVGTAAMPYPLVIRRGQPAAQPQEFVQPTIPGPQVRLGQTGRAVGWVERAGLSNARFAAAPEEAFIASSVRPGSGESVVSVAPGQLGLFDTPQSRLAQELGLPERTAEWLISQDSQGPRAARQVMGLRNRQFAEALAQRGTIPSAADATGVPIGELIAQSGEIREDPIGRALRSLNSRLYAQGDGTFLDEAGYSRDLESGAIVDRGIADPTERPISAATLSADELAALMPTSRQAAVLPYGVKALSPAEKEAAYQESGASKTRGGRRNALAKEPNIGFTENAQALYPGTSTLRNRADRTADPDDRYTWFTPGGVIGAGLEPNPATAAIPLLLSPRSQERFDQPGQFQAPSVYLKSSGGFVPGLADARILDVNPLAQLSPAVAEALGAQLGDSFYTMEEPDRSITGGYAGRATNAPIPDPATGGGGFDPLQDPAAMRSGSSGGMRPMTVAEAVARISTRNLAPISPVMLDQIVGDGQVEVATPAAGRHRVVLRPDGGIGPLPGTLMAGRPLQPDWTRDVSRQADVYPLGRPSPAEQELSPAERLHLQAQERGQDFADARVGSRGRYQKSLYGELDTLIGALAAEAFPDARARYQLQNTASDLATGATVGTRDRFNPAVIERPVGNDWSLLINTAGKDPLVARYQNELLSRVGMNVSGDDNPLLSLVDSVQSLAGVPLGNTDLVAAAPAAQRVAPGSADLENALRRAKITAARGARSSMATGEDGVSRFAPATNSFARRDYELNARAVLAGILSGQIPLAAQGAPVAASSAPVAAGVSDWLSEPRPVVRSEYSATPQEGASTAPRAAWSAPAPGETVIASSIRPGFNENPVPVAPGQLGLPGLNVPYSHTLSGFTPDPIDDVAAYMAQQARRGVGRGGETVWVGPDDTLQYELQGLRNSQLEGVRRRVQEEVARARAKRRA